MGFLARRFEQIERRNWLTDDDAMFEGPMTASGTRVSLTNAGKLSSVWACWRILSNTIATMPKDVVISVGSARFPEFQKPSWLVEPDPADPSMTPTEHFSQVTLSILTDGNSFTFCPLSVFDPSVIVVLNPSQVEVLRDGRTPFYRVRDAAGQVVADVDAMHMLHTFWIRMPGALRGLSPLEAARQGIGTGLTTEEYAGRFFGQGTSLSFGVEVPGGLTPDQRKEMTNALATSYAGTKKSHAVGVLTAGAKFVTGLGVTNEQSQFLESRKFTVEDIGRIYGVPPHMLNSQEPGASSYNSVEMRGLEFRSFSVQGLVSRIEDAYRRIVSVPTNLATTKATAAFKLNMDGLTRADLKTRYESYASGITSGVLTPNEARALEDLPPLPGGDVLYIQSGTVPLDAPPPLPALAPQRSEPIVIMAPAPAKAPDVYVQLRADTLHVEPPIIPPITIPEIRIPSQPAPVVNVTVPETVVNITMPDPEDSVRYVTRDPKGRIEKIIEKRGLKVRELMVAE